MLPAPQMSVTRQLAAALTELRATGATIHHLGAGYPNPQVSDPTFYRLQTDRYLEAQVDLWNINPAKLYGEIYGYTDTMGPRSAREAFAKVYGNDFGATIDPDHVVPTTGASGGIDLLCALFEARAPKLAYIVDAPTYPGFLTRAARHRDVAFYSVEMDAEGPIPESLRERIRAARSDGFFVPFYYTVPDGHNPAGISFSQRRREEIYRVLQNENILLVEDSPYTYISFTPPGERPKPFLSIDTDGRVVHLFTASKIGLPGPRVGFAIAQGKIEIAGQKTVPLSQLLATTSASSILMHNPQALRGFEAYLHDRNLNLRASLWPVAEEKIRVYGENRAILLNGLVAFFGVGSDIARWTIPGAGFFSVITFLDGRLPPSPQLAERLLKEHRVTTVPMVDFYPQDARTRDPQAGMNQLRLAFSFTEGVGDARRREMETAVEIFSRGIHSMVAVP